MQKKTGSAALRTVKLTALTMLAVMLCSLFAGCAAIDKITETAESVFDSVKSAFSGCSVGKSDEDRIRDRIATFERKYNEGDYEGVLDCLDAGTRNATKAMINIMGGIGNSLISSELGFDLGVDMGDMFSLGAYLNGGDLVDIKIDSINIINGVNATADGTFSFTVNYYEDASQTMNVRFVMVKEGRDWFIKDIRES